MTHSIFFLIPTACFTLLYCPTSFAENFVELKYGHLAGSNNTSDDLTTPTFGWKGTKWRGHILKDFSFNDDSTRERIEIETSYAHEGIKGEDGNDGKGLTLFNEITYDVDKKSWSAELTPAWFTPLSTNTQIGLEVELDYFKNDEWGLHEVEIEPTIRYKKAIRQGEYKIELEMPIFRVHSKNIKKDDIKYEGLNLATSYRFPLNDNNKIHLKISLELPYDAEKKELREKFFISLRQKFN